MSALCGLYLGAHALSGLNIPLCVYYCVSRLLSPPPLGNASQFPAPGVAPGRFYPYGSHALPHLCVYSATAQWCHAPVLPRLGLSFERRVTNGPCAEAMLRVYRLACMPAVFPCCHSPTAVTGWWVFWGSNPDRAVMSGQPVPMGQRPVCPHIMGACSIN